MADSNDPVADNTMLRRSPDALFRWLLDGVLVLTPHMEAAARISSPADLIWDALAQPISTEAIAVALADLFGAPVETVRADIAPILSQLHEWGAVVADSQ